MKIGFVRLNLLPEDFDLQMKKLEVYCNKIYNNLNECIADSKSGDTLVVARLFSLHARKHQIHKIIKILQKKDVKIESLERPEKEIGFKYMFNQF